MYSSLLLLLWIHTISDDTTLIVLFQGSSYPVPTRFTLYAFIAYGYDWSGQIILETEHMQVCNKYAITFTQITKNNCYF